MESIRQLYVTLSLKEADDYNQKLREAQKEAKAFERAIKLVSRVLERVARKHHRRKPKRSRRANG